MSGSCFGKFFRVTTFGESHCKGVGCIVEGVPPRMLLREADIQPQLNRRRPGLGTQAYGPSGLTTPRSDHDVAEIWSGTEQGVTLGTPVGILVRNKDQRPKDYSEMLVTFDDQTLKPHDQADKLKLASYGRVFRPGHADLSYQLKYGIHSSSGGGRSSARETIGRVVAGAIAEKWLKEKYGSEIVAWVSQVADIQAPKSLEADPKLTRARVDATPVCCPHPETADAMLRKIHTVKSQHNSCGGVLTVVCRKPPTGLGEPCFDKLEALLAHGMLSIPATKGFEIGSGFNGILLDGKTHNDAFVRKGARMGTKTNYSGGVNGGISNGEPIVVRVAFKPTSTIGLDQETAATDGQTTTLRARGRFDPCILPRAIPIVEAMMAMVLADAAMGQEARQASASIYPALHRVSHRSASIVERHNRLMMEGVLKGMTSKL